MPRGSLSPLESTTLSSSRTLRLATLQWQATHLALPRPNTKLLDAKKSNKTTSERDRTWNSFTTVEFSSTTYPSGCPARVGRHVSEMVEGERVWCLARQPWHQFLRFHSTVTWRSIRTKHEYHRQKHTQQYSLTNDQIEIRYQWPLHPARNTEHHSLGLEVAKDRTQFTAAATPSSTTLETWPANFKPSITSSWPRRWHQRELVTIPATIIIRIAIRRCRTQPPIERRQTKSKASGRTHYVGTNVWKVSRLAMGLSHTSASCTENRGAAIDRAAWRMATTRIRDEGEAAN